MGATGKEAIRGRSILLRAMMGPCAISLLAGVADVRALDVTIHSPCDGQLVYPRNEDVFVWAEASWTDRAPDRAEIYLDGELEAAYPGAAFQLSPNPEDSPDSSDGITGTAVIKHDISGDKLSLGWHTLAVRVSTGSDDTAEDEVEFRAYDKFAASDSPGKVGFFQLPSDNDGDNVRDIVIFDRKQVGAQLKPGNLIGKGWQWNFRGAGNVLFSRTPWARPDGNQSIRFMDMDVVSTGTRTGILKVWTIAEGDMLSVQKPIKVRKQALLKKRAARETRPPTVRRAGARVIYNRIVRYKVYDESGQQLEKNHSYLTKFKLWEDVEGNGSINRFQLAEFTFISKDHPRGFTSDSMWVDSLGDNVKLTRRQYDQLAADEIWYQVDRRSMVVKAYRSDDKQKNEWLSNDVIRFRKDRVQLVTNVVDW